MTDESLPSADVAAPLRERRRATTRRDIADAALRLFEQQGYDRTTVEQIADAAGISLRTFYRHSSSKDEALTFGLATGPSELASEIRARRSLPFDDAVLDAFVSVAGNDHQRRELRVVLGTPALRSAWLAAGRAARDDLAELMTERDVVRPAFRARARAAAIAALLTTVIEEWTFSDMSLEPLAREALSVLAPAEARA
ncbi:MULTISPECIES: TetR/AcrR family transcriptional regulator [Nocardiaceae]|uniref:AcrR family transcriptional regulator n=1 Tax=Rhodococcoides corynebacterioides TaxID=53972 RepID=A0ABS2KZT4_9NOCA|nr:MULTISPECIES: TetR/AcrR family transcriptional regulator [Rhodococcus]MBM7417437.1 AcrR family transcriptional regulator [Rhodococcus corynebacterioides]MBP1115691.1 AcrR family transcriptional regulator [Rhodococcus sp. PvP016]